MNEPGHKTLKPDATMNSHDSLSTCTSNTNPAKANDSGRHDPVLDPWRREIREHILEERRRAAIERGELAAPPEAFVSNERELTREIERRLEKRIEQLERQREAMEQWFLEIGGDEPLAPPQSDTANDEQSVRIDFDNSQNDWSQFWTFETTLESVVEDSGLGEYDGNVLALDCSVGTIFLYGPDVDHLFSLVRPYLIATTFMKNAVATLTYGEVGEEGVRETTVQVIPPH
jgi:hypothetical protein